MSSFQASPGMQETAAVERLKFARDQLRRIQDAIANSKGAKSVVVDGVSVTYDDLLAQHRYWQNEFDRVTGQRPISARIKLSGL
jgi:hypothetical protein